MNKLSINNPENPLILKILILTIVNVGFPCVKPTYFIPPHQTKREKYHQPAHYN
jgi:hypothetical protein